jgi:nucleotide-binding universal stress UspA family protein
MSYSEILIPVDGTAHDAPLLACGRALGAWASARVVAAFPQADPGEALMWSTEGFYTAMPESVLAAARKGADEAWARVSAAVQAVEGVESERLEGTPEQVLMQRAALTDLAVFACESARGKALLSGCFEALLMGPRTPVLIPRGEPSWDARRLARPVLVAWDGGDEAARAVRGALPFLRASDNVVIAQVKAPLTTEARRFCEPERLVAYLAGHGVVACVETLSDGAERGDQVAQLLLEAARGLDAHLIVAGAYGHSRLREFVFGGATRTFLAAVDGPALLLSH